MRINQGANESNTKTKQPTNNQGSTVYIHFGLFSQSFRETKAAHEKGDKAPVSSVSLLTTMSPSIIYLFPAQCQMRRHS